MHDNIYLWEVVEVQNKMYKYTTFVHLITRGNVLKLHLATLLGINHLLFRLHVHTRIWKGP